MTGKLLKRIAIFLGLWWIVSAAVGGCHCTVYNQNVSKPQPVYVKNAPPPAKQEVRPPSPSGQHVWVSGAWAWNEVDDTWEWVEGSWQIPPENHVWIEADYEVSGDGTVIYTPGYWEKTAADTPKKKKSKKSGSVVTRQPGDSGDKAKDEKKTGKAATRKAKDGADKEKDEKKTGKAATRKDKEKSSGDAASRKAKDEDESGAAATRKSKDEDKSGTAAARK